MTSEENEKEAQRIREKIKGLSNEHKEKLTRLRPETLGHAQRIDGVTPAALGLIIAHLKNNKGA